LRLVFDRNIHFEVSVLLRNQEHLESQNQRRPAVSGLGRCVLKSLLENKLHDMRFNLT